MSPPNSTQEEVTQRGPVEQESYKPEHSNVEARDQADISNEQDTHNAHPAQENQTQNTHTTLNNNNEPLKQPADCDQTTHTQNSKCVCLSTLNL